MLKNSQFGGGFYISSTYYGVTPITTGVTARSKADPSLTATTKIRYYGRKGAEYRPKISVYKNGGARHKRNRKFRYRFTGWPTGKSVFVNYYYLNGRRSTLFKDATKVKTARIGRAQGPCGHLRRKMRRFDKVHLKPGLWWERFIVRRKGRPAKTLQTFAMQAGRANGKLRIVPDDLDSSSPG